MPRRSTRSIAREHPDRFSSPIAKVQSRNELVGGNKQGPPGTRPFKDGEKDFDERGRSKGRR